MIGDTGGGGGIDDGSVRDENNSDGSWKGYEVDRCGCRVADCGCNIGGGNSGVAVGVSKWCMIFRF